MNQPKRKRGQLARIGLQLLYLTIPPILILLLFLRRYEFERDSLIHLVLGGLFCILLEAVLLLKFFRQRIADDNYDLVKIIRQQVDQLFGMAPLDKVQQKNRRKYYTPEDSVYNRLFEPRASNIYQNVMSYLRSNQQVDYLPRMRNIENRCGIIDQRLRILGKVYEFILSNYEETSKIYAKVAAKNVKEQYSKMEFYRAMKDITNQRQVGIFQQIQNNVGITVAPNTISKGMSWKRINDIVQQMGNIYKTNGRDITNLCSQLIGLIGADIRSSNIGIIQKLKSNYAIYKECEEKVSDLTARITEQKGKIELMEAEYARVRKKHDNYEAELNAELNLELSRVELSNLNVRECNARDLKIKAVEELYLECQQAEDQIKNHELTVQKNSKTLFRSLIQTEVKSINFVLDCIKENILSNTVKQTTMNAQSLSEYRTCLPNVEQNLLLEPNTIEYYSGKFQNVISEKNIQKAFLKTFFEEIINQDTRRCEKVLAACSQFGSQMDKYGGSNTIQRSAIRMLRTLYENRQLYLSEVRKSLQRIYQRTKQYDELLVVMRKSVKSATQKYRSVLLKSKEQRRGNPQSVTQLVRQQRQSQQQLAHYVNKFSSFSMGDSIFQNELMKAVSDLMVSNRTLVDIEANKLESLNDDYDQEPEKQTKYRNYKGAYEKDMGNGQFNKDDIYVLNKILDTFFEEWRQAQYFHKTIGKQLYLAFNRKRPDILDEFVIQYFKIENKSGPVIISARTYPSTEIFNFIIELDLNFQGQVYITAKSRIRIRNGISIQIKILLKKFIATLQLCYTPLVLGKSYVSMMSEPTIDLDLQIQVGNLSLHRIPLLGKIIKALMIVKLRKLLVWPARTSILIPMSLKDTRIQAVRDRLKFQRQEQERQKLS